MIFGDYHTHTKYSKDAKNTLAESIKVANNKGLKQLGISEHSFSHLYGVSKRGFEKLSHEVEEAKKNEPLPILLGMEVDLLDRRGNVSVSDKILDKLDFVILSFHKSVKWPKYWISHLLMMLQKSKKSIDANTNAYIEAIKKHRVSVLGHLNSNCKVNVLKLALFAKENNILIELNNKHMCFSKTEINEMVSMGVNFIMSSDAHCCENVGEVPAIINFIEKYNIPTKLIANYNRLPIFK